MSDAASGPTELGPLFRAAIGVEAAAEVWYNSVETAIIPQNTGRAPGKRRNRATWYNSAKAAIIPQKYRSRSRHTPEPRDMVYCARGDGFEQN